MKNRSVLGGVSFSWGIIQPELELLVVIQKVSLPPGAATGALLVAKAPSSSVVIIRMNCVILPAFIFR